MKNNINNLYIVGADASRCVFKTSQGAKNRGYSVTIIKDAIFSIDFNSLESILKECNKNDIDIKTIDSFKLIQNN